jgi:hypothetical protein
MVLYVFCSNFENCRALDLLVESSSNCCDVTPLEQTTFTTVMLRKLKARTLEELQKALQEALNATTLSDVKNWFAHDGYKTISI